MTNIKTLVLISALVIPFTLSAAESVSTAVSQTAAPVETAVPASVKTLSFDDCYNLAQSNNRDFKIAKLDKAIAEAGLQKGIAGFGPSISVAGGYQPVNKASTIPLPAIMFGNPDPNAPPVDVSLMPQNWYSARFTLTQPIFTFGKTFFGFQMANEAYKIANINYKKAQEKLKLDIISSFYGALITQELYKAQAESLKSNEEYLKITKAKYANGQASNFEVLQAQVNYANALPEAKRSENMYKLSVKSLKNTIGMDVDEEITLSGMPEYKKLELTYADVKKRFTENNDDRDTIKAATNIASYNKNLAIAMLLPNIALSANYTMYSGEPAFHREAKYWDSSWDATIGFQWTLFDSFKTQAGIKEALAGEEKAKLNQQSVNNMLSIQLDQIYMSMDESAQVIEAAADVIKTAEEGLRIAKESYKNGLIQSVDLMNAEIGLLRSKINYLNALNTYTTNMQKLKNYLD